MNKTPNICKDCVFYMHDKNASSFLMAHLCTFSKTESVNLVTGDIISCGIVSCDTERSDRGRCKPQGTNFYRKRS